MWSVMTQFDNDTIFMEREQCSNLQHVTYFCGV